LVLVIFFFTARVMVDVIVIPAQENPYLQAIDEARLALELQTLLNGPTRKAFEHKTDHQSGCVKFLCNANAEKLGHSANKHFPEHFGILIAVRFDAQGKLAPMSTFPVNLSLQARLEKIVAGL
jgi:hypothetical protein